VGAQHALKLWMTETNRELFQVAGNPPVKPYVESTAFRNTVVRRATELGVRSAALDWDHCHSSRLSSPSTSST
jgi:hypothetical protein